MAKNNIRSFRFSDEVKKILEKQEGNNLNEKFENLVFQCYFELPKLKKTIKLKEDYLKELNNIISRRVEINNNLQYIQRLSNQCVEQIETIKSEIDKSNT